MSAKPFDVALPHSHDAERAVLGAILYGGDVYDRAVAIVGESDFANPAHRLIFAAMGRLSAQHAGLDLLTLKDELSRHGLLAQSGGTSYVSSLMDSIPDVANVERYALQVREKAMLRALIAEGNRLMHAALEPAETAAEIAARAALNLTDLAMVGVTGPISVGQTARRAAAEVEARSASRDPMTGIPFGITHLDGYTLGIQRGVESMLAARPRVGKTAFALSVALTNAERGNRTLFVELDMSERMIGARLLSSASGVAYEKIRSGQFISEAEWGRIAQAKVALSKLDGRLVFDYGTRDLAKLSALVRREARQGLDLVIVDHIGHVTGVKAEKRYLEIGGVSTRFLELAGETDAALLALVQLGRDTEKREPSLSDLRESGNLEQDARLVVMLDRPFLREEPGYPPCRLNVLVPKNEGESGVRLTAHFDGDVQRITQDPTRRCRCESDGLRESA